MIDLTAAQIQSDQSVLDAVACINRSKMQIAFVVDADGKLLGTVTDGDIRRGLLGGADVSSPVRQVMNTKPSVAYLGDDQRHIEAMMRKEVLRQIPILDEGGRLVDVHVLGKHHMTAQYDNAVLLMAGGFGTRLEPLTQIKPKPMLSIGGKPILQTILEGFVAQGFWRFYISVFYKSEVIEDFFGDGSRWNVDITYLHEDKPAGTGGALSRIPDGETEPMIVMNADILCQIDAPDLLAFHRAGGYAMTACVSEHRMALPFGRVTMDGDRLIGLEEKPMSNMTINAGIYVVNPALAETVPHDQPFQITDLIEGQYQTSSGVGAYRINGYWRDVGSHGAFEQANREFHEIFGDD